MYRVIWISLVEVWWWVWSVFPCDCKLNRVNLVFCANQLIIMTFLWCGLYINSTFYKLTFVTRIWKRCMDCHRVYVCAKLNTSVSTYASFALLWISKHIVVNYKDSDWIGYIMYNTSNLASVYTRLSSWFRYAHCTEWLTFFWFCSVVRSKQGIFLNPSGETNRLSASKDSTRRLATAQNI